MRLVNWRSLAIGVAGFGLAACGDDVAVVQPVTLTPSQTAISCNTGQTIAIGASLNPAQSGATFQYTGAATPANAFTVTGSGATATLVCTNAGTGSITITAGGQTVTVPVTVQQAQGQFSVIIAPSNASVAVGGTVTVSGTILGTGTLPAVRYRSAQPAIATVDSISGVVRGVAPGVATIIASPAGQPGTAAAATVTVLGSGGLVSSIVANPSSVALQTGQTQQISATVNLQANAPTNTARTVTYQSQNTAIATVSTTGLVTGVANGSTSIIVRSTADTAVFVAVPVTVRAQTPVRITIAAVTTENLQQAVDITQPIGTAAPNTGATGNNNTGSIFVTLSLDPGDATVSRVDLFLAPAATPNDTTNRVCSQVFSAQLADAYRLALSNGSADVQPIVCPINLAAFDTTTGTPRIRNGASVLRARVTGTFPGTTGSANQIAQFTQNLTINNRSGFFVRVTNTPDAAQATVNTRGTAQGPDGRNWIAGALNFAILPVSFESPNTGNNAAPSITVTLTDTIPTGGVQSRTLTSAGAASGPTTISFPGRTATQPVGVTAGGNALGNVSPRSFNAADQNLDGWTSGVNGTRVVISGIGFNTDQALGVLGAQLNGSTVTLTSGAQNQFNGAFIVNVDNQAPQPASQFNVLQPNFTSISSPVAFVGFLGRNTTVNSSAVTFANRLFAPTYDNTLAGANFAGSTTANGDFGGVDRVTTTFAAQLIAIVSSVTAANIFTGATTFTTGSQLAAAPNNQAYAAVARFVDVLGNGRSQLIQQGPIALSATTGQITAAGTDVTFGVDLADPILSITNAATLDTIVNAANSATANNDIAIAFQDAIGFGSTPLTVLGQRQVRNPDAPSANAPATYCLTAVDAAGNVTFNTQSTAQTGNACTAIAITNVSTLIIPNNLNGQYSFDITTRDQAGNVSPTVRVNEYIDVTLPGVGATSLPQILTGNANVTFTSAATDNLELGTAYPQVAYSNLPALGVGPFTLSYASQSLTQLGRPFDNVFTATNSNIQLTIPNFIRSATFTAANGTPGATTGASLAGSLISVVTDAAIAPGFQANQASTAIAIPAGNITQAGFGSTVFTTGNQTSQINAFVLSFANGNAAFPQQLSLGNTANAPTSGTFTVSSSGQLGAFINPFARVELWYTQVGGPAVYQRLGNVVTGLTTDNTASAPSVGRTITSTNTFTAINSPLAGGVTTTTGVQYNVIAVAVTAAGDALISQPVTLTILP
jgi:hypothetical protein